MRILTLLLITQLLIACGSQPVNTAMESDDVIKRSSAINLNNRSRVTDNLYQQHSEWKGTRYQLGGLSKKGIDCSGFVYTTYLQRLGYQIPRTTELQSNIGQDIKRSQLRPGDLVFFKTGFKTRHVGIYVDKGQFLHASTSRGVMLSKLDNVYWEKNYWKAVRVL